MHPTKNDIALSKRTKLTQELSFLLNDAIDLYLQIKQAHWNVHGASFIALHELFDKVASETAEAADMIAERMRQLGADARGDVRFVAKQSRLKAYPLLVADGAKHVEALSSAMAAFNAHSRKAIDETNGLGDAVTADMLTEITRGLDKLLWFVESHIQVK